MADEEILIRALNKIGGFAKDYKQTAEERM